MYDVQSVMYAIGIGLVAGFLAGVIVKGRGFGILGDIVVGIFGAIVGAWLFSAIGLTAYGVPGTLVMSLVGAIAFLALINAFVVRRI